MSKDYYFKKWRSTLKDLESLIELDLYLQTTKANEDLLCLSVFWLTGILAKYIAVFKDISTCLIHSLQVQKTDYYNSIAEAIEQRIAELKNQLCKLESSNNRFFSSSLICHKLTPFDIEPNDFCIRNADSVIRDERIKKVFENIARKKENEKQAVQNEDMIESDEEDTSENKQHVTAIYEVKKKISESNLEKERNVKLIQSQERTRQVIKVQKQNKQRREKWLKELTGNLNPPARFEIKEKASKLIQTLIRKYFELKRKKILDCQRDEMLGLQFCMAKERDITQSHICGDNEKLQTDFHIIEDYKKERTETHTFLKSQYLKSQYEDLKDDHRDFLREWFLTWYEKANYFFNIPTEALGGSTLILKDEVLTPYEWIKQYQDFTELKNKNKNKTEYQKSAEKRALKMEKLMKRKLERKLQKKCQNLAEFKGYDFPTSKTITNLQKAVSLYHETWDDYDSMESLDAKERFVKRLELNNAILEVKKNICYEVDDEMRVEHKRLKQALKADYEENEEIFPETMNKTRTKQKKNQLRKKHSTKTENSDETISEFLEELAERGFLKQYPKTFFEDFKGDHNFIGDDMRCLNKIPQPYAGEMRNIWWDRCRQAATEFQRILLVGPSGGGRSTLVHILATANDATFYEFDPCEIQKAPEFSAPYLMRLVNTTVACAKATQPAVIYIRHVQHLYLRKTNTPTLWPQTKLQLVLWEPHSEPRGILVAPRPAGLLAKPPKEAKEKSSLMKTYFIKKLCKFNKNDKITVIEPWDAKMQNIERHFQTLYFTPNTSYAAVSKLLQDWVLRNRTVPADFPISGLAYALQGYQYDFLKHTLCDYLAGERLIKISATGLEPIEVYDYVVKTSEKFTLENVKNNNKPPITEYNKYWVYYLNKTTWGKKEVKKQNQLIALTEQRRILAEKEAKKKKAEQKKMASNVSSMMSTLP